MNSSNRRSIHKVKRFTRDVKKLSPAIQREAFNVAQQLAENISSPGLNVQRLTGWKGVFRVVVMTEYRMIFSFDRENLYLLRIGHRKEIYRNLEL